MASKNNANLTAFFDDVVMFMAKNHQQITFEADSTDEIALAFKNYLSAQIIEITDTYIYSK